MPKDKEVVFPGVEPRRRSDVVVVLWRETMMSSLARQASHGAAALRRAFAWSARKSAERRAMKQLARMSDYELSDIGLVRQDIVDAGALRPETGPSAMLSRRRAARERGAAASSGVAA
jgi:uncharacterized protein YjiS (DUF1127 family)